MPHCTPLSCQHILLMARTHLYLPGYHGYQAPYLITLTIRLQPPSSSPS